MARDEAAAPARLRRSGPARLQHRTSSVDVCGGATCQVVEHLGPHTTTRPPYLWDPTYLRTDGARGGSGSGARQARASVGGGDEHRPRVGINRRRGDGRGVVGEERVRRGARLAVDGGVVARREGRGAAQVAQQHDERGVEGAGVLDEEQGGLVALGERVGSDIGTLLSCRDG